MSKWQEDTMYEITMSIREKGIEKKFRNELKKLSSSSNWKWRPIAERYEHAYNKVNR